MCLLILVVTSLCRLGEATLFENHPVDTLALKGSNVTLNCTLQNVLCQTRSYSMYWKRGMTMESIVLISDWTTVYISTVGNERYMVTRSGCTWTFHIRNLQPNDEGYYSCYVYKVQPGVEIEDSNVARLVVGPIDTTVIPSQIGRYVGQNATFRCQTRPIIEYELTYTWYIKSKYNNHEESWPKLTAENNSIAFNDNSKTMTMLRLRMRENGTAVKCKVFKRSMSITGKTNNGLLIVHRNEVTMETNTGEMTTSQMTVTTSVLLNVSLNQQSTQSVPQDPDSDSNNPSSGSTDSTVILVGGAVGAGFLALLIVILLYFLVCRRRSQSKTIDKRKSSSPQDDGGESDADGISKTQLHGVTPRCDQENDHTSSEGERSVDSPRETVTVAVTSDLHQQAETKHDQDNVDKPLSTETDGSVKDWEKRNDKQNHPESMYAVVDKSHAKSKTLGAQTLSSYSKHETPSERQKSTVTVKDLPVPGRVVDRQPSAQKPPRVIPYHHSKRRASNVTQAQAGLEQTADHPEDGLVKDDPREWNVEGLIYADLDLSRGSARIINPEEETVYADFGNK